ncbi:HAD-IA family hydrolase [Mucilaginibacter sp. UR6-1]|uniref:HAD family hydrolase n=1 Tax=Mucilaginibacter sp. UR6-1 TaxID=1435643 RepID=UPI001E2CF7F6|nr:HAD-IA family hydrolase [Mucilaginibacter sp. UR6-1]MCC8407592.1 HAD-IA family hydrolase [Mucilaginibacter sp. UR6-1]
MINDVLHQQKLDKLTEISKGYKAFLYDCDGTLADNMPAHKAAYIKVAANGGLVFDGAIVDELAGWPVKNVVEEINKRYNSTFDPVIFAEQRYQVFYDEYIESTQPISFVVEHLKAHVGKVLIAVVSGSGRRAVERTLGILGILNLVEVLVCAGETEHGKPYPDPFLAAAEKLGVAPADCLVFEDGEAGTKAAEAAGMQWVRIDKI